jgi:hypothetical protein
MLFVKNARGHLISVDEFGREYVATIAGGSWKGSHSRSVRTLMRSQRAECFQAHRGIETRASRQRRARKNESPAPTWSNT